MLINQNYVISDISTLSTPIKHIIRALWYLGYSSLVNIATKLRIPNLSSTVYFMCFIITFQIRLTSCIEG